MHFFWVFVPNAMSEAQMRPVQLPHQRSEPILPQNPVRHTNPRGYERLVLTREDLIQAGGYGPKSNMWSQEEDRLLLLYRDKHHLQWDDIAQKIPGRTGCMCYNRYKRIIYRSRALWRQKDDKKLLELIGEHGENWKQISKHLTSTHDFQAEWKPKHIEEHYLNHLRPGLSHDEWTLEDDLQLIEVLNRYEFDWSQAEKRFPQRSMSQIKNRFKSRLRRLNEQKKARQEEKQQEIKLESR